MHGILRGANGVVLMAADIPASMDYAPPAGMSLSLSGDDDAALRRYWEGLADGGSVVENLAQAPWGASFGMLIDRYGIDWMVNISPTS